MHRGSGGFRVRFGSLFSGIGGFDLGLERAGLEPAWQVEIDPSCNRVLERHWPKVGRGQDIRECEEFDAVDLVCGGFPCQDLSVAGKRAGLAGERSGLFFEFARVVASVAPRWVLIENVPGLLSSNGNKDMATVVGTLAQLGYGWAYRVVDAQYFGVAQRRRRVFIVGCLGDSASAAQILFEPESCSGDPPPSGASRPDFAGPVAGGAYGSGRRSEDDPNLVTSPLLGGGRRGYRISADEADQLVASVRGWP
ncbi:MAG: DNA cytosine methyltransferase [Actinomycetota bacterium]